MLTPTLLDVAGLTGLKPTGQTFDPESHESKHASKNKEVQTINLILGMVYSTP